MGYIRREFHTNNKQIQNYFDTLMTKQMVTLPPMIAREISRHKTIRNIRALDRHNPYIFIGEDTKFRISMVRIRDPVKISKKGDRYIFDL